jgi:hypothetical protein
MGMSKNRIKAIFAALYVLASCVFAVPLAMAVSFYIVKKNPFGMFLIILCLVLLGLVMGALIWRYRLLSAQLEEEYGYVFQTEHPV